MVSEDIYDDLPRLDFYDSADPQRAKIYSVITTWDRSPTLAIRRKNEEFDWSVHERMHHPKGAWTETLYIYGQALEELEGLARSHDVYVVGLGCGYIEMLTVARWLAKYREPEFQLRLRSFESDPFLIEGFQSWLRGLREDERGRFHALHEVFDSICQIITAHFRLKPHEIRETLRAMQERGAFILENSLNREFIQHDLNPPFRANALLYDAFSSKTDPYLWEEGFLKELMSFYCEPRSLFATYAARGVLNRALAAEKFVVKKIAGYGGKRESTFGIRT